MLFPVDYKVDWMGKRMRIQDRYCCTECLKLAEQLIQRFLQHQQSLIRDNSQRQKEEQNEMAINFPVSKEDILRGKAVKPGVYTLLIKDIKEGPGKSDPSSNVVTISMVIESGPNGDNSFNNVPVSHWLSEKAPGMAIPFIEAVTGQKIPETGANPDLEQCKGRKVKAFIKNEMYQGRPSNKIDGFMPV